MTIKTTKQAEQYLSDRFYRPVQIGTTRHKGFRGGEYSAFTSNPNGGENLIGIGHDRTGALADLIAKYAATRYAIAMSRTVAYRDIQGA